MTTLGPRSTQHCPESPNFAQTCTGNDQIWRRESTTLGAESPNFDQAWTQRQQRAKFSLHTCTHMHCTLLLNMCGYPGQGLPFKHTTDSYQVYGPACPPHPGGVQLFGCVAFGVPGHILRSRLCGDAGRVHCEGSRALGADVCLLAGHRGAHTLVGARTACADLCRMAWAFWRFASLLRANARQFLYARHPDWRAWNVVATMERADRAAWALPGELREGAGLQRRISMHWQCEGGLVRLRVMLARSAARWY